MDLILPVFRSTPQRQNDTNRHDDARDVHDCKAAMVFDPRNGFQLDDNEIPLSH
jgi:hypothetical protein